jgi:hypothetical protein
MCLLVPAARFATKYGSTSFTPLRVTVTVATFAAGQVSELWIDDVAVVSYTALSGAAFNCPSILAESLASASQWVNIPTSDATFWQERTSPAGGYAATGINVTFSSGARACGGWFVCIAAAHAVALCWFFFHLQVLWRLAV